MILKCVVWLPSETEAFAVSTVGKWKTSGPRGRYNCAFKASNMLCSMEEFMFSQWGMEGGLSPTNIILLKAIVTAENIKHDNEQPHKDSEVRERSCT